MKNSVFNKSKVDIIIPYHGQYERVRKLVESIMIGVRSNPYQITLIDDFSPNEDFGKELNKIDPIVRVFRSKKQLGFGGAINLGVNNTVQPWTLFLNSDCVVEHNNWMLEMGRSLIELKNKGVRVVTARNNLKYEGCPDIIQGKKEDIVGDFILDDGFIPLFSFMCHRDLFKHIGGLIKEYPYGNYEDEEFAYRLNSYGFKQAICGKSWIYHEGSATFNYLLNKYPNIKNDIQENRNRCINDLKLLNVI